MIKDKKNMKKRWKRIISNMIAIALLIISSIPKISIPVKAEASVDGKLIIVGGKTVTKNMKIDDVKKMFGDKVQTKFRPHHFPFTEPSAEMDATCFVCGGKGCNVCKGSGWIEMLGCGMVHPNVLRNCGIDPEEYSGFAFGFGIDRMVMLSYGLDDIRLLYESDMRFLNQF